MDRDRQVNWRTYGRVLLAAVMLSAFTGIAPAMAEDGTGDGAGKCGKDEELDGNRCYPVCKDDGYTRYEGDGEECWQICPSNSQDYGHVCLMGPAQLKKKMFKRGPGRPVA